MNTVWQIAAGDGTRDYSPLLLGHDVMIIGPGSFGSMADGIEQYEEAIATGQFSKEKINGLRRFYADVKPGDLVLLRRGYRAVAIGLIDEDRYEWDCRFDDVYGWDLQHTRRVVWQDQLGPQLGAIQRKAGLFAGRKQIPTFTAAWDKQVIAPIRGLLRQCVLRPLKPLPEEPSSPLRDEEVGDGLFSRGLSLGLVEDLLRAIGRQRRLLRWYYEHGPTSKRPTEHEVVAYMVLPMLLALGWSEQLLAVEWRKVDLAAFTDTPTIASNCVLACEAKGVGHGLQDSLDQAKRYVRALRLDRCRKIMLTQGGRFYLYERSPDTGEWGESPTGYFNVEKIRRRHVTPANTDALETLMKLTPARIAEQSST